MKTSLSWIKKYIPDLEILPGKEATLSEEAQEYTDALTLTGTKVESFELLNKDIEKIVVGQIIKLEKHPDADKLVVCQVNIGNETIQIVTGAKNVKEGDKIPVVLDGGRVATGHDGKKVEGGTKIKKGKLRGVESNGMFCSIEEFGSSREEFPEAPENGVYVFPEDQEVGVSAIEALGFNDVVFEYEITSNRVDCYGVIGIAREAFATFVANQKGKAKFAFIEPKIKETGNSEKASDYIDVTIEDKDLCNRFCARVVKNVKIGPSPKWMQDALWKNGIRPINNLVDITNYVMEEYGQPMHAYDLDKIEDNKIIVRRGKNGEKFTTLDGNDHEIDESILMICDGKKPVGIAGIMGGENSMITDEVKNVLFEAANFDGTNIRLSSKKLGLRTDASNKFEKGLDPYNAKNAVDRACELMEELGVGEVVGGIVDVYDALPEVEKVKFEPEKINKLLGTNLTEKEMITYLEPIGLKYEESTNSIIIPSFRRDLHLMADIAEEVVRFYGYDKIPTTLPVGEATFGKLPSKLIVENVGRDIAEFAGFSESMTYSFESPKVFDKLLLPKDSTFRNSIVISNPLGEDYSIMRTTTIPGMLSSLSTNYNRRNKDVKLYEMGNVYRPKALPLTELPEERMHFTLGAYGDMDFFRLKGIVLEYLEKIGVKDGIKFKTEDKKSYLHPGRQGKIFVNDQPVGYMGQVHPKVTANYSIGEDAYVAVLDIDMLLPFVSFDHKYEGIAKYPAVTRDLSLVVPKSILAGDIEDMIKSKAGKYLEELKLFDIYEGSQIKSGFKSMAYSLSFRAKDRTLDDQIVGDSMNKILKGLESLGIELRS